MNNKPILIAIACGLLTAMINVAPFSLGGIGLILTPFTVLPIFVSVLGFGTRAGLISGAIATVALAAMTGILSAIAFFVLLVAPPLWVGHLAGLVRREDGAEEWYPLNNILLHLALASALVVIVVLLASGITEENSAAMLRELMSQLQAANGAGAPNAAAVEQQIRTLIGVLPVTMPASIIVMQAINFNLGARIARSQGWMLRPQDDIPMTTALPFIALGIFGLALLFSMFGGSLGVAGKIFAGAFGMAFALVGLATMHALTRGMGVRPVILAVSYIAILFTIKPLVGFAILGIVETLLGLRARRLGTT